MCITLKNIVEKIFEIKHVNLTTTSINNALKDELFKKLEEANIIGIWVVLDNCPIYKTREVLDKVSTTSHRLIYFPP